MDHDDTSPRLVLVLESYTEEDPWVNACVIANAVEIAGDKDVRLAPDDTGLSFSVLAETDVVGPLFMVQLGPAVGALDDCLLDILNAAVHGNWDSALLSRRGVPIMSRTDARWRLKEDEIAAIHSLSSHCLQHLVEANNLPATTSSATIAPELFEEAADNDPPKTLLRVASFAESEKLELTMPAEELCTGNRLNDWITDLGPDEWRALEPIWHASLRPPEAHDEVVGKVSWTPQWPGRNAESLAQRLATNARRGRRTFRVLTDRAAWKGHAHNLLPGGVLALDIDGVGCVQVKPELVDEVAA
jgi:hypothetical protein